MTGEARIVFCLLACGLGAVIMQELAVWRSAVGYARPRETSRGRLAGQAAAMLVGMQCACLFMLITARPYMATVLPLSLLALLLVVNRVKENVLREPLVIADAWLLPQVFLYPEMYIPFMPMKGIVAGGLVIVLVLAGLTYAEPAVPLLRGAPGAALCAAGAAIPALGVWLLRTGSLPLLSEQIVRLLPVSHDAGHDAGRIGPLAAALVHPVAAGLLEADPPDFMQALTRPSAARFPDELEAVLHTIEGLPPTSRPHVLLIQAESFCDMREHGTDEQRDALKGFFPGWDALRLRGGTLPTPEGAYGAYTMRTEFSMLTGLSGESLGVFSFNPYLLAARKPVWSIARHLSGLGYTSLCLHPYYQGFFCRDKVMRNLGFDRFLGLEDLRGLPLFGPYVSDRALGERLLAELEHAEKPVFCFAITMEAHGPWRSGRLTEEEIEACLGCLDKKLFSQEQILYLCHAKHMDQLFAMLANDLTSPNKPVILAYGDHLPSCIA